MQDLELVVDDVAVGGDGIARADDGRVVFVRGGVPGDRLLAQVVRERPRRLHAQIRSVEAPSDDRVSPPCPHVADGCGGCGWQHLAVDAQRRWKRRMAEESLRRLGRVEGTVDLAPPLPDRGYRTTVRCLVTPEGLAFRGSRSHEPVAVERCLVAHPGLDELIAGIHDGGYGVGPAREVTLRIGGATGERMAVLDPGRSSDVRLPDDVLVVGADELRSGRRAWIHDEVAGRRFRVSARSFFQSRTDGAAALVHAVGSAGAGGWGTGRLVDLYGGVGLFAATLGRGMDITLVESSASSVADARHNLSDLGATVVRTKVENWRPSPADVVVADPPRAGLGSAGVAAVVATKAQHLVLVSCDAAAFGRDVGLLADAGYARRSTVLVDLFPHTPHVELVSAFEPTAS